jgi:hypothetical protein
MLVILTLVPIVCPLVISVLMSGAHMSSVLAAIYSTSLIASLATSVMAGLGMQRKTFTEYVAGLATSSIIMVIATTLIITW